MADLFNNINQNQTSNNLFSSQDDKQKEKKRATSFVESVKEQGQALTEGFVDSASKQIFGPKTSQSKQENPNQSNQFNFNEFLKQREQKIRQQERMRAESQRRQEHVLFHRKDEETKKEIEQIKIELKKIIKATGEISEVLIESEKTVTTTTVDAGDYYVNFFQRIRKLIAIAKKRLSESQHWLEVFNQRTKSKSHYWGQVQKSGTKYMLSHERSVVTQTN